jgi:putative addiction module killer protein
VKITLNRTELFATWLRGIRNISAKARIFARLDAAKQGNFSDWRSVGGGIFEMRVDVGAGYRIYYAREDTFVYLLLAGGDKNTQDADIKAARKLWQKIQEEQK